MGKNIIKLSESDLYNLIKESVNEISAETYGPLADVNYRANHSGLRTKKQQIDSDWEDLRNYYPYGGNIPFDYDDSECAQVNAEYPFGREPYRDFDMEMDWEDYEDADGAINKYTNQANSRPLHRKGSLNRALEESIRRAIRKVLH